MELAQQVRQDPAAFVGRAEHDAEVARQLSFALGQEARRLEIADAKFRMLKPADKLQLIRDTKAKLVARNDALRARMAADVERCRPVFGADCQNLIEDWYCLDLGHCTTGAWESLEERALDSEICDDYCNDNCDQHCAAY
jgi:hypothetical protein